MGFGCDRLYQHHGPPLGSRRKRGAFAKGIGTSRGGSTSKIHGLTDAGGRPRILLISPGNTSDMTMAPSLVEAARGRFDKLIADRGYDSNAIRAAVEQQGAEVVIPSKCNRKAPLPYDRSAYRTRNLVERLWCRLKPGLASPLVTTNSPPTIWPASTSPQQSPSGAIESQA